MNRRRSIALAITVASIGSASSARAQSAMDRAAMAEVLFDDGRRLVAAGRFVEGCAKLAESERLDHGVGTLLNLADCYERAGLLASAWTQFRAAAAAASEAGQPDREAIARDRMLAITPWLQRLAVRVPPADAALSGFELRRDDIKIDAPLWGVAVPLDPGPHRLEARATNKKTWTAVVDVPQKRGALVTETIPQLDEPRPGDPKPEAFAPESNGESRTNGRNIAAIGLFAGAGAGLILGTVFGVRAISLNSSSNDNCVQNRCDQSGFDTRNEARTSGTVSTIAFAAAGALAAGGVAVLIVGRSPKGEVSGSIGVSPSPTGAALFVGGHF